MGINISNKAFKSDSQRLAVSLRSSIAKRHSHLNAALELKKIMNQCPYCREKLLAHGKSSGLVIYIRPYVLRVVSRLVCLLL